ncbi:hypothetical protein SPONN_280 [uncultured Candidatus Thioglobus sp.]|nr:hypothetical protein SPONN_280 [uncultured Candidatus Thioglobus sp.]
MEVEQARNFSFLLCPIFTPKYSDESGLSEELISLVIGG